MCTQSFLYIQLFFYIYLYIYSYLCYYVYIHILYAWVDRFFVQGLEDIFLSTSKRIGVIWSMNASHQRVDPLQSLARARNNQLGVTWRFIRSTGGLEGQEAKLMVFFSVDSPVVLSYANRERMKSSTDSCQIFEHSRIDPKVRDLSSFLLIALYF